MTVTRHVVHRMSDAAFTALGAGCPDDDTLAELRRSQLSRHLLLLRGIVRAAPGSAGPAYELLAAAQRAAPGPVREVLAQPLVGVWAAGCLAALHAGAHPDEAGVEHLAALARSARGGSSAGRRHAAEPARRLRADHDGLRLDLVLDDAHPLRGRVGLAPTGRLTDAEAAHWHDNLRECWRLLVDRHRGHARVIAAVLTWLIPVATDRAARGVSASSADAFGAVAMSAPADPVAMAVALLHETQHSLLNAALYLFDLVDDPGTAVRYSPWRDDPRPAVGLLHGAYAYLGVTDFWRVRRHDGDPVAAFEFARWRAAVHDTATGLLAGETLTPAGARFAGALRGRVASWHDEPVPAEVLRLAEGANADHRLRWRLRNLTPDPPMVSALAGTWRAGQPAPLAPPVPAVRTGSARALEDSSRLHLTHRLLRGATLAGADPADAAYVRGDLGGAARAYRARVRAAPADDAAWAGLALTAGDPLLRDRVETVAAVHRALSDGGDGPCPLRLAGWLESRR